MINLLRFKSKLFIARLRLTFLPHDKNLIVVSNLFGRLKKDSLLRFKERPGKRDIAIVTALAGDYDKIVMPVVVDKRFDYYFYTDQDLPKSEIVNIRKLPFNDSDDGKNVRYVKTHSYRLLKDYETVVWADTNIVILGDIYPMIESFLNSGLALGSIRHPFRDNIYQEGAACIQLGKSDPTQIQAQLNKYKSEGFSHNDLAAGGLLMFNHSAPKIDKFLETWWSEIVNNTGRDQLSLNYSLAKHKLGWYRIMSRPKNITNHKLFAIAPHSKRRNK